MTTPPSSSSAGVPLARTRSRISCGISIGGIAEGLRSGEPVQAGRVGRRRSGLEDLGDLRLVERLLVEQREDQRVEDVAVLLEDVEGLLVGRGDEALDLLVDLRGDVLGVVALVADVAAEERLGVGVAELDRAEASRSCRTG